MKFSSIVLLFLSFNFSCIHNQNKIDLSPPIARADMPAEIKYNYRWIKDNVFGVCSFCHTGREPYVFDYKDIKRVLVPNHPEKSRLYYMVRTGRMPKGGRLNKKQISAIYYWIKDGAPE